MSDRTGRPEQIQAPAMRGILNLIDRAIENGSLDPQDRDEVIQMFLSEPKLVLDNKAMGGMMNINDMTRPLSFAAGGPTPPDPDIYSSPTTGKETGETIGEIRARPKKPSEVDRQQIYQDLLDYTLGNISEDEFFDRTGFFVPVMNMARGGGNFDELFSALMRDLNERGYTNVGGGSLVTFDQLNDPVEKTVVGKAVGGMMDIDTMTQPVGLMEDADNLKILGMKLMLQEAADSLDDLDRIDKLSPDEIIIEFENLIGKKGA